MDEPSDQAGVEHQKLATPLTGSGMLPYTLSSLPMTVGDEYAQPEGGMDLDEMCHRKGSCGDTSLAVREPSALDRERRWNSADTKTMAMVSTRVDTGKRLFMSMQPQRTGHGFDNSSSGGSSMEVYKKPSPPNSGKTGQPHVSDHKSISHSTNPAEPYQEEHQPAQAKTSSDNSPAQHLVGSVSVRRLSSTCNQIYKEVEKRHNATMEAGELARLASSGQGGKRAAGSRSSFAEQGRSDSLSRSAMWKKGSRLVSFVVDWVIAGRDIVQENGQLDETEVLRWKTRTEAAVVYGCCSIVISLVFTAVYFAVGYRVTGTTAVCHIGAIFFAMWTVRGLNRSASIEPHIVLNVFVFMIISLNLTIPLAIHVFLGGGYGSSDVMVWTLLAPCAALFLMHDRPLFMAGVFHATRTVLVTVISSLDVQLQEQLEYKSAEVHGAAVAMIIFSDWVCPVSLSFAFRRAIDEFVWWSASVADMRRQMTEKQDANRRLIHGLFPPGKAEILATIEPENWHQHPPDHLECCSMLQMDIKGFTELSSLIDAEMLVDMINAVFTSIDEAAELIGNVWKVETIGDCYKAVIGGFSPCADHAHKAMSLACAILEIIRGIAYRLGLPLKVRCGVHTGNVTGAIVGSMLPRYLVYGKACEILALMEATADPGHVQCTQETAALLGKEWILGPAKKATKIEGVVSHMVELSEANLRNLSTGPNGKDLQGLLNMFSKKKGRTLISGLSIQVPQGIEPATPESVRTVQSFVTGPNSGSLLASESHTLESLMEHQDVTDSSSIAGTAKSEPCMKSDPGPSVEQLRESLDRMNFEWQTASDGQHTNRNLFRGQNFSVSSPDTPYSSGGNPVTVANTPTAARASQTPKAPTFMVTPTAMNGRRVSIGSSPPPLVANRFSGLPASSPTASFRRITLSALHAPANPSERRVAMESRDEDNETTRKREVSMREARRQSLKMWLSGNINVTMEATSANAVVPVVVVGGDEVVPWMMGRGGSEVQAKDWTVKVSTFIIDIFLLASSTSAFVFMVILLVLAAERGNKHFGYCAIAPGIFFLFGCMFLVMRTSRYVTIKGGLWAMDLYFFISPVAFMGDYSYRVIESSLLWAFFAILLQAGRGGDSKFLVSILAYGALILTTHVVIAYQASHLRDDSYSRLDWWVVFFRVINHLLPTTIFLFPLSITAKHLWFEFGRSQGVLSKMRGQVDLQRTLLEALVPQPISIRLQEGEQLIADRHESATIMFIYLADFDELMSTYGSEPTIAWLCKIFSNLDACVSSWAALSEGETAGRGVTKVETFNNFYLAVSGCVRGQRGDRHADDAVLAAAKMVAAACHVLRPDGKLTELKVGLNSGSICAGVIGIGSPRFSIFGDTVNVASRMASTADRCAEGRTFLHMTEATASLLSDEVLFRLKGDWDMDLKQREHWMDIKGKGSMRPWFVEGFANAAR